MTTSQPPKETARHGSTGYGFVIPGVEVVRHGRVEPFLHARPTLTSTAARWAGLALEGKARPPSGRARQRGASMQEWLHPAMAHHFDSGNDEAIAGGPVSSGLFRWLACRHDRNAIAENPSPPSVVFWRIDTIPYNTGIAPHWVSLTQVENARENTTR